MNPTPRRVQNLAVDRYGRAGDAVDAAVEGRRPMALEFQSPRFAGDPLLLEILNDPDTGTLKLGPGSPPDSVTVVQKALWDLQWPQRVDTPITVETQFVIGTYGPVTTKAVTKFKTQYDIHFPPDAPTGFIDGFTGPRTLRELDKQCVLFDPADAELQQKADEVFNEQGLQHDRPTLPSLGTNGAVRMDSSGNGPIASGIYFKVGLGTFLVAEPFFTTYAIDNGGTHGILGWPIAEAAISADGEVQRFQGGRLRVVPGQVVVEPGTPPPIEVADPSF